MTTTRDWAEELSAYIDGELDEETTKAVEAQLSSDPSLKRLEQQLRQTVSLMASMQAPQPSLALRRQVLLSIDEPTWAERVRGFLRPSRWVPVGALVAVGVVALVASRPRERSPVVENEEQLFLAQEMDVLEDLDLVDLQGADDLEVVAGLHELKTGEMR